MKNKFLIGARLAGVMLAVMMLAGSAFAAVTVEVKLTDITKTNGTTRITGLATNDGVVGVWPSKAAWDDDKGVTARYNDWLTTGTANHYDSVLVIEAGAQVEKVIVMGDVSKASTFPKLRGIVFIGGVTTGAVVEWDGASVKGAGPSPANSAAWALAPEKTGAFLSIGDDGEYGVTNNYVSGIHIIDGTIEAWSQYIIRGVGGLNYHLSGDPLKDNANATNLIGHWNSGKAVGKSLNLIHHGTMAAIEAKAWTDADDNGGIIDYSAAATGERATICAPNNGTYTITSDVTAIVTPELNSREHDAVVIGSTGDAGEGKIIIDAWVKATAAATSAAAGPAIKAGAIKINGKDISGNNKGVVVKSRGKTVLDAQAPNAKIQVFGAELQHAATAGLAGAVAVSGPDSVIMGKVKVNNGTANGNIPGVLIGTVGYVGITGGSFTAATGGTAINTSGHVVITGAKIWASGAASKPAYVVQGDSVALETTATDSALVVWAGSGTVPVGGISARKVWVRTGFGPKAEVRVAGGGIGISVQTVEVKDKMELVHVEGNPSTSAFINVASGQAIKVDNNTLDNEAGFVYIENAKIARTATNTVTPMVDVRGGHVFVRGVTLERMSMSSGSDVAIQATKNARNADNTGGDVWINGGNIAGVAGAVKAERVFVEDFGPGNTDNFVYQISAPADAKIPHEGIKVTYNQLKHYPGTLTTSISSTGGITINAIYNVLINNGFASVINTSTANDDPVKGIRSAAVYSLLSGIDVYNVDSIKTNNAIGLLTVKEGGVGAINVYGGKVKSTSSYAISSSGDVLVDWDKAITFATSPTWTAVPNSDAAGMMSSAPDWFSIGGDYIRKPSLLAARPIVSTGVMVAAKRNKIEISTNATTATAAAIYAPYATEKYPLTSSTSQEFAVTIGDARVFSNGTSGGASGIVVNKASVTIAHKDAQVISQSGTGVKVTDANVTLDAGDIVSNPSSGNFAGIWVVNGNVNVGTNLGGETAGTEAADLGHDRTNRSSVSSNGALAIYLDGAGAKKVTVGYYGILSVKGTGATAGMIKVTRKNTVEIQKNAKLISTGSQAFAIEAEEGNVDIKGGRIESLASKQAISTKGGNILISGVNKDGSLDRHIDGGKIGVRITGNEGVLVRAIKNSVTGRAGEVIVSGGFIYNKYGTGIWADDTLRIKGGEIVTDKDTAVRAGTTTAAGLIEIDGGEVNAAYISQWEADNTPVKYPAGAPTVAAYPHVWAAAQYAKATPVAVAARMIRINGGVVEANTIKSSADNTSTYPDSKATGVLLKKGPGTPLFKIGAGEWNVNETKKKTTIIAHGANTAIDCQDSSVTLDISAEGTPSLHKENFRISVNGDELGYETLTLPGHISVKAGDNGVAVKSVGEIRIKGSKIDENSRGEDGLAVGVYIGAGNGTSARAITMPVPANANKHKDLTLSYGFVEAGSDGATAIDADAKAIVRVDHSVVLVRHLSTAINGKGGVYIDAGYVEVLATENNTVGTAVTGRNIRISGGAGSDDDVEKSEIHSKGVAVKDNVEGAVVQVTGRIHMSGTVASNMKVGASVVTDTGVLTMGSVKSRNLWKLTTVSDQTVENEKGKALYIPLGVTIEVGDNGSSLGTEKSDTIHVAGVVTTVGKQAGARFLNGGRILVEKGGNVKFNKDDAKSFKNSEGAIIVLKMGSLLDDSLLVHDTGLVNERKAYTFLKWAKLLSGDTAQAIGTRGPGRVIVPPMYATLYGNQRIYVDEDDRDEEENDFWTAKSERTDSAYTAKFVLYPLDRRYKPYFETEDFPATGDFTLGGQGTVKVDEDGTVLLTEAGKFTRTATMDNEAGTGTKTYTHIVERVDINRIIANQTEGPIFFDGYFYNKNRRVVGHDGEDTVTVREGNVEVKYTGGTAHLLDGIKGAEVEGYTDIATDKPIYYAGLGNFTYWYKGSGDTYYPLTSSVPKNVGTYDVFVSATQGNNFEAIPSDDRSIVPIGTINVVEGDIESVFGKKDNESYQLVVDLEAKVAKSGVKVALPSVLRFGAKYDNENIEISGTGETALVGNPTLPDSILTFSVNATSEVGKFIEFKATILNTADPANLTEGNFITVRARFLSKEDMKETKPNISVNYRDEKLKGLEVGTIYTINGQTLIATSSDTTISEEWVGKTINVVALPGVGSYKTASDTAKIVVGVRPEVTDSLRAVKGENAKTNLSVDGRLTHTSSSMEYKTAADTAWRQASPVVTTGLPTGTYSVRLAPTATAFPSASVTVLVGFDSTVTVLAAEREIPNKNVTKEVAVAPVAKVTATFTAGPSPVSKNGTVKFFSSKQVKSGALYVYDATGKSVAKLNAKSNGREIGSWNLRDKKGAVVAEGSYVVKGKLVNKDGTKESVSALFNVTK